MIYIELYCELCKFFFHDDSLLDVYLSNAEDSQKYYNILAELWPYMTVLNFRKTIEPRYCCSYFVLIYSGTITIFWTCLKFVAIVRFKSFCDVLHRDLKLSTEKETIDNLIVVNYLHWSSMLTNLLFHCWTVVNRRENWKYVIRPPLSIQ